MAFVEVDTASQETTILSVPYDKIFKIKGAVVTNTTANNATVTLTDKYTYTLGDSSGSAGSRTLIKVGVPANSEINLTRLEGEEIIGDLVVVSDQVPVYVYVGVTEKGGM